MITKARLQVLKFVFFLLPFNFAARHIGDGTYMSVLRVNLYCRA